MSHSVKLCIDNNDDIDVTLQNVTLQELKQKVPSYHVLIQSNNIIFKDEDDCELECDDDLEDAFDACSTEQLIIKIVKIPKANQCPQTELGIWLKSNKLDKILSILNENDINDLEDLKSLESENEIDELIQELNLKIIQRKKFKKAVSTLINQNVDKKYNENIVNQLISLEIGNKSQIIQAMDNVNDRDDIDEITEYIINNNIVEQPGSQQIIPNMTQCARTQCSNCGSLVSSYLIENHQKHCSKDRNKNIIKESKQSILSQQQQSHNNNNNNNNDICEGSQPQLSQSQQQSYPNSAAIPYEMIYITCCVPLCNQRIPIDEYDSHALLHTLDDQQEIPKQDILIPCEYSSCNLKIPLQEFESHLLLHTLSQTNGIDDNKQNLDNNGKICAQCIHPSCNQRIPLDQYEQHQLIHIEGQSQNEDEHENKSNLNGWISVPKQHFIDITSKYRTVMVIGATGTGKTTLLNSMMNYLWNVKYNDSYRYKLIYESQKVDDQSQSQTDNVTAYHLNPPALDYQLTVIDTPGYGDTRGIERDKEITKKIKEFFETKIQQIDAICFVIRAPQARLTPTQKYVFSQVLGIFGNDIKENIFVLLTFADNEKPPALAALKTDNVPYKKWFKFNNSGFKQLYDKHNEDHIAKSYWNMGIESFKILFNELNKVKPQSLTLTKQVLTRREQLEAYIEGIQPTINQGYSILDGIRKQIIFINKYCDLIDANKDFMVETTINKSKKIPNKNGCTTTCIQCNYTCHPKCGIPDDGKKDRCSVMRDGDCTVCPSKCIWMKHRNLPYTVKWFTVTEEKPVEDLKNKYYDAKKKQSVSDQLIEGLTERLDDVEEELNILLNNVRGCINELASIALRANVLTQHDYIDKLIQSEEDKRENGWEQRCESLRQIKKKQKILNEVNSTEYNPWASYNDVKQYLNQKQMNNNNDQDDEKKQYFEKEKYLKKQKKKKEKRGNFLFGWF